MLRPNTDANNDVGDTVDGNEAWLVAAPVKFCTWTGKSQAGGLTGIFLYNWSGSAAGGVKCTVRRMLS